MFLRVKNGVCRGWKVPNTECEANIFCDEVIKYSKQIEVTDDGVFSYEKRKTKGGKVFVIKTKDKRLVEVGCIHTETKVYEPIWSKK